MSIAALINALEAMGKPGFDPVAAIVAEEKRKRPSCVIVRPGESPLLPIEDWREAVISIKNSKARLVLLHAARPGTGAFTKLIERLREQGIKPAVIEPTREFSATLIRRGWRGYRSGTAFETFERRWEPAK